MRQECGSHVAHPMQVLVHRGEALRQALAEQGFAADAFQRPLRSRFQARLKPGVRRPGRVGTEG
jgi:hypothetical protein